jgi:hypothetical protein
MKFFVKNTLKSYLGDDLEVLLTYDYEPAEPVILYPNDRAHPGSPENVEITSVEVAGQDILENLNPETVERFEMEILDWIHDLEEVEAFF